MRKILSLVLFCTLLFASEIEAKELDGDYWSKRTLEEKTFFVIGYCLGYSDGADVGSIKSPYRPVVEEIVVETLSIKIADYVGYIDTFYELDNRNSIIPIKAMITLVRECKNKGLDGVLLRKRLSQLREEYSPEQQKKE